MTCSLPQKGMDVLLSKLMAKYSNSVKVDSGLSPGYSNDSG